MVACYSSEFTNEKENTPHLYEFNRKNAHAIPTPAIILPWEVLHSMETLVAILGKSFCSAKKHARKPTTSALVIIGENHTATPQSHPESCLVTKWAAGSTSRRVSHS